MDFGVFNFFLLINLIGVVCADYVLKDREEEFMRQKCVSFESLIRKSIFLIITGVVTTLFSCTKHESKGTIMSTWKELTPAEARVILNKGTEQPFTGEYTDTKDAGTYICRQCGTPLYRSEDKFHSGCGWPAFDDALPGAVKQIPDADGQRTEIVCTNCGGHLGHVFVGEHLTEKNTRHCVNSISMKFIADTATAKAWFGGGCFWGVEHLLQQFPGVSSVVSGYMGGEKENPTYQEVCSGSSGHAEVVEVTYDPSLVSYERLAQAFFEIHDPTQLNRQGPDVGNQYRSIIFVSNDKERNSIDSLIGVLRKNGYDVVTEVENAVPFYKAEEYHQDYYEQKGTEPYCHRYVKRF